MTSLYQFTQNYDSDDEGEDNKFYFKGRDITIFVIDTEKSMFEKITEDETAFDVCLTVLEKLFLAKIRHNSSDQIGVIFYNTEKSPNSSENVQIACPAQCAILYTLQSIEADIIRYIKNTKASGDYHDFSRKYGHSSDTAISDVLWLCHALISNSGMQIRSCSIVWFTNNDLPHPIKSSEYSDAMKKTNDMKNLYPDFQLIPLKESFNCELFYEEFMSKIMNDRHEVDFPHPTIDIDDIVKRLFTRYYRNRALTYLPVEILGKPQFSVGVYSFTSKRREPKAENISRVTKEIIVSKRGYKYGHVNENNDIDTEVDYHEKLLAEKTVKYIELGGEKIKFTPLELYEMKQFMQPAIRILGFKPMETFNPLTHKRSPYFIYPHDFRITNSTKTFRALWETCLNANKYILCIAALRLKSYPRFIALIPQRENQAQTQFDGFRMEFLPYSGEIRDLSEHQPEKKEVDNDVVYAMTKAISKLTINYDVTMFKNPAISKIYNKIERIEFSEDGEEFEDVSIPKVYEQDRRMGDFIDTVINFYNEIDEGAVKKRTVASEDNAGSSKRPALDIEDALVEACKKGNTKNISVTMLRDYLKSKNISGSSSMKKDQLVAKVIEISYITERINLN